MSAALTLEHAWQVEQFLYNEAALLDAWDLDHWIGLFAAECAYEVTPPGLASPESLSPERVYFLIADDRERLEARITRLKSPAAHAEFPRSRTRHVYTNVRVEEAGHGALTARANFITYRNRNRMTLEFMGGVRFDLLRAGDGGLPEGGLLIARKRIMPDMDALIPQGRVSFFL